MAGVKKVHSSKNKIMVRYIAGCGNLAEILLEPMSFDSHSIEIIPFIFSLLLSSKVSI